MSSSTSNASTAADALNFLEQEMNGSATVIPTDILSKFTDKKRDNDNTSWYSDLLYRLKSDANFYDHKTVPDECCLFDNTTNQTIDHI